VSRCEEGEEEERVILTVIDSAVLGLVVVSRPEALRTIHLVSVCSAAWVEVTFSESITLEVQYGESQ
jgi:hypothetical protein